MFLGKVEYGVSSEWTFVALPVTFSEGVSILSFN